MAVPPDIAKLVEEKSQAARSGDHFALLGLDESASKPEVQKAYFDLAKILHPDRLAKHDLGDAAPDAAKLFKSLSDAYKTLMDPDLRLAYERKRAADRPQTVHPAEDVRSTQELLGAASDPTDPDVNSKEAAKIFFHRGMMLVKKGGYEEAQRYLERALESDPDNARYQLQLGWAIFQTLTLPERRRLEDSKRHMEAAIKLDGENPQAHYFLARWHKAKGNTGDCRKHLNQALALRENYIEVKRELRLLDMREQKAAGTWQRPTEKSSKSSKSSKGSASSDSSREGRWPFGLDRLFKKKK